MKLCLGPLVPILIHIYLTPFIFRIISSNWAKLGGKFTHKKSQKAARIRLHQSCLLLHAQCFRTTVQKFPHPLKILRVKHTYMSSHGLDKQPSLYYRNTKMRKVHTHKKKKKGLLIRATGMLFWIKMTKANSYTMWKGTGCCKELVSSSESSG